MNLEEFLIKVSSLSKPALLMFSAGVTLVYFSFFYDDGSTLKAAISRAQAELQAEREKEKESDLALKEIDTVKTYLEALTQQFNIVSAKLPRELQMAEVIRTVDIMSKQAELTIRTKEPRPLIKEQGIEVLPIQITADGSFSQIVRFLHYITATERIFRIQSLNLKADEDSRNSKAIKIRLDVASYRFVPEEMMGSKEAGQ
jgi:Tfp pilus assembly protein PilO